jgi:putative transcriptional regulator
VKVDLAPGFVVAMPTLRDPNFERSVVLLVEHGPHGSLGFVVNRPSPFSFEQVAHALGVESPVSARVPVFFGGPVAPRTGWILFDPRGAERSLLDEALVVHECLAVSASRRLLERIARDGGPTRCCLALGYAGWAGGQLDAEFRQGAWIPVDWDPRIVFDTEPSQRWLHVLSLAGIEPGWIVSPGGDVS